MPWTEKDIPDLAGRTVVVTGSNSGIGLEAAEMLAGKKAHVVLACRNQKKGAAAIERIKIEHEGAKVSLASLDLADLASVKTFADAYREENGALDILINNAGVMALPFRKTEDGFEMQFGTNHLGHFALTAQLFDLVAGAQPSRIVNVSSSVHRVGKINFSNLQGEKSYSRWPAYAQSKLANLLFTKELARRAESAGLEITVASCHPGYASTNLQTGGARMSGSSLKESVMNFANGIFAQSAKMGAMPTVYAAVADEVSSGDFIGPDGAMSMAGYPKKERPHPRAEDEAVAARLWDVSEELTAVPFEVKA